MTKVNLDLAQEFLRQHKVGRSYVDIAKDYRLDNKTVSYWVKKAEGINKELHWAEIGKDLDTQSMREHRQMLLAAARGVLRAVETPPKSVGPSQAAEVLVKTQVLAALQALESIMASRGINVVENEPGFWGEEDWNLLEGMAAKLQVGLYQHLPELKVAEEQWASDWQRFRDEKDKLVKETTCTLVQSGMDADVADRLTSSAVGRALGLDVAPRVEEEPPDAALEFAMGQVEPRNDGAREALARVRVSVAACRDLVEDALLRGGPLGRCDSCPSGNPG